MKIGIKYCGGCNPSYDRVAAAARIRDRFINTTEIVPYDDPAADIVFAVMGCSSACADLSGIKTESVIVVKELPDVEDYIASLSD